MQEIFIFSIAFRPSVGPTQPDVRWVPGGSILGPNGSWERSWPL